MTTIATDKLSVIVGMGLTGQSCARFLSQLGRRLVWMDTRSAPPKLAAIQAEFPQLELITGGLDRDILLQADELVVSPGVSLQHPDIQAAIAAGVSVRGDIDIFVEYAQAPVVAITGSNGKSTVTTLVGKMAREHGKHVAIGGNLGTPALALLDESVELYVLELSSFQLETTQSLNAECVVLLNISEDHMDRYTSKLAYLQAKQRIFRGAKKVVINDDEPLSQPLVSESMELIHFGMEGQDLKKFSLSSKDGEWYLSYGFDLLMPVADVALKGQHNLSNALAALALGSAVGLRSEAMLAALRDFSGLPHRCQWLGEKDGVNIINDSKGTNTGATATAIASFGSQAAGRVVLIAGGDAKGADMSPLLAPMKKFGRSVVVYGRDAHLISQALEPEVVVIQAVSFSEAVSLAFQQTQPGDVLLFSPACASFDMFANYQARGDAFVREVATL